MSLLAGGPSLRITCCISCCCDPRVRMDSPTLSELGTVTDACKPTREPIRNVTAHLIHFYDLYAPQQAIERPCSHDCLLCDVIAGWSIVFQCVQLGPYVRVIRVGEGKCPKRSSDQREVVSTCGDERRSRQMRRLPARAVRLANNPTQIHANVRRAKIN